MPEPAECWACGEPENPRQTFALEIREHVGDHRGNHLAVYLCIECQSLIHRLLDRIREARYRATPA